MAGLDILKSQRQFYTNMAPIRQFNLEEFITDLSFSKHLMYSVGMTANMKSH